MKVDLTWPIVLVAIIILCLMYLGLGTVAAVIGLLIFAIAALVFWLIMFVSMTA